MLSLEARIRLLAVKLSAIVPACVIDELSFSETS